jgi:hypothetical protein
MSDFAEFDAYCEEHPDLEPHEAFASWLAETSGETIIGRETNGDGLVVGIPREEDSISP